MARALLAACMLSAAAAASPAAGLECEHIRTQLIPLPIYSTLPNEGSTFGFMPVFLRVCDPQERTLSIFAPSVSWNEVIHTSGTVRLYHYPSDDENLTFIASASTRINSNLLLLWRDLPHASGTLTREVELRWERSAFYRFFGLGPDTPGTAETSYTRIRAHGNARAGINLGGDWNAGLMFFLHHDDVQDIGVPGLPLSRRVFPTVPGMTGATTIGQMLDLRYDSRPQAEYSRDGFFAGATAGPVEGIDGSPAFLRGNVRLRWLHAENAWLSGSAQLDTAFVSTAAAPFYDQSTLGGAFMLRGFTENRFIDRNSWLVSIEQRIRVLETHIFGVTADWRIDPFVSAGQVYGPLHQSFSHPRLVGGAGFRAFVHPNVLGRIDVASGGEGMKVYVELGYPY